MILVLHAIYGSSHKDNLEFVYDPDFDLFSSVFYARMTKLCKSKHCLNSKPS